VAGLGRVARIHQGSANRTLKTPSSPSSLDLGLYIVSYCHITCEDHISSYPSFCTDHQKNTSNRIEDN
jgi:hypothetical protein